MGTARNLISLPKDLPSPSSSLESITESLQILKSATAHKDAVFSLTLLSSEVICKANEDPP